MTCREATEFLTDYLAGELPSPVLSAFERHISRCENCRIFLSQFRDTIVAGARAFETTDDEADATMPPDLVAAIVATVRREDQ